MIWQSVSSHLGQFIHFSITAGSISRTPCYLRTTIFRQHCFGHWSDWNPMGVRLSLARPNSTWGFKDVRNPGGFKVWVVADGPVDTG
jgi:hypothetical protein